MNKPDLVEDLKQYRAAAETVRRTCAAAPGKQLQARAQLTDVEALASRWFDHFEPLLRSAYSIDETVLAGYRSSFGRLLELVGGKPSKTTVLAILASILQSFHAELVVPVQQFNQVSARYPALRDMLPHASISEQEYLLEAIECSELGKRRAAVVLGWCAAIARIHNHIERTGFDHFNDSSLQMSAITTGRYKRFTKKYQVHNISDLQITVFDSDLLWVLEFMGLIDSNQHERLGICFTMRNNAAHPGEAPISEENLLSFFSDIDAFVFANSKLSPDATHPPELAEGANAPA